MSTAIKKDFGDWLSPILVKEIRQGFRSRVFVSAFLLIQGLMILCVILDLISEGESTEGYSVFFWVVICLALLLIMPSHGFSVLGSEIKGNTMELLFLTRLSAWRIVAGKWTAIISQTLLIVCSVLPYVVLRYFIGGVDLLLNLVVLGWLLAASAILTSIAVAISPFYRSMLARLFLPIIVVVLIFVLFGFFNNGAVRAMRLDHPALDVSVIGPLFLLLMFEIAVSRIAPPAENHSFRKRLLGFLILGGIALLNLLTNDTSFLMALGFVLLVIICVTAMCEEVKPIPSVYLPFVKRGFPGRMAGLIFYPGWPSGFLFTLLAFAAYLVIFFVSRAKVVWREDDLLQIISMAGALVMPLAFTKVFFGKRKNAFIVYLSLQCFMFIIMILAAPLQGSAWSDWMKLASPLPTSVFFLSWWEHIDEADKPLFIFMSSVVLILSLIILLIKSAAPRREIAALEKVARDTLMKPKETEIANANAA